MFMDATSQRIRENILRISHHSGHGHIPTCFSIIEMLRAVYETMRHDPLRPGWDERDIFILSKGHGALGLYCTLAQYGYFPIDDVYRFGAFGSSFGCHADRFKVPGVELSTGSLGHGIGVAVGMAMGFKLSGCARRVYTLIGDGESNEGTVWEALMVAAHEGLSNLTVLFDNNRSQSRCLPIDNPEAKFRSFGFSVSSVDGHNVDIIKNELRNNPAKSPRIVIANTLKGAGSATLTQETFAWHRRSPNKEELSVLLGEL
jgi:transketolase